MFRFSNKVITDSPYKIYCKTSERDIAKGSESKFIRSSTDVRNNKVESKSRLMSCRKSIESSAVGNRRIDYIFRLVTKYKEFLNIMFNFLKIISRRIFFTV